MKKSKTSKQIAEELEEPVEIIEKICKVAEIHAPS